MTLNLYSHNATATGTSQNSQLIYNFDTISITSPVATILTTASELNNIRTVFPLFTTNYASTTHYSFTINSQLGNQHVSYSDNITPSPIQYTIKYIHIGISPIQIISYKYSLIIECTDSTSKILLIIIPLKLDLDNTENSELTNIITYITNVVSSITTQPQIDINKIMPFNTYNTYSTGTNRVIYFTEPLSYKTGLTFINTITALELATTLINIPAIYTSLSNPQKKIIMAQNDIYIDCYRVGEKSNITGGIINVDTQTNKIKKTLSIVTATNMTYFYILVSLFSAVILIYVITYFFKSILKNADGSTQTTSGSTSTSSSTPAKGWFSGWFGKS